MELKINGIKAELRDSSPAITRKSVDVSNPSLRFIDYSNKFILPDTQVNRELLESPTIIGSDNRSFNKLYNCTLEDVFQIFSGYGFLDETEKDSFNFQLVDKSKELFNNLKTKLNAINWDDKDTELTQTAIDLLDTADSSTCWYWGKACYHINGLQINTDQTTGDDRTKYSRPAFNVTGLLYRAILENGYTLTLPDKDLAVSSNHEQFYFTSYQKTLSATYSPSGTLALSGLDTNDFEHSDLTVVSASINIGTKSTAFRIRGTVSSDSTIYIVVRAIDDVDSTKISESRFILPQTEAEIDFTTSEFQSDDGMTVDIYFEGTGSAIFTDTLLYTILNEDNEDLSTNPWLDYKIKAYDNLPDLTYLDLFKLICVVYNKHQIVDNFDKLFSFGSLANLNKLNTVDWSEKFIRNTETVSASVDGLAQKNYLNYENDETVNSELGQDYFLTDNESLDLEDDYITLSFGASNEIEIDSNNIAHLYIYEDEGRIADQTINIRLFEIDSDKLTFSPINWANLKADYYQSWFDAYNNIRVIQCKCNLNKLDVISWSEKQLVYIDHFKSTFIVLEINNFIPGQATTVKLLRYGR